MNKISIAFLFVLLLIFTCKGTIQEQELDVPYVPTPYEVVAEMLRLADVGKDDILYDLGSGDGRIVITAAKEMGCHGVGVEIDSRRIKLSRENAAKEKVSDRVKFIQQDMFKADISKATVLAIYLLQSVNIKLRPKFLRELKPGTRIVSHNYSMGDWKADKTSEVDIDWRKHTVYFWVVPANATGTWEWSIPTSSGNDQYVLKLVQRFQEITGTLFVNSSGMLIGLGEIIGDKLQFTVDRYLEGQTATMLFSGRISGNSIEGSIKSEGGSAISPIKWKAQRDPSTVIPIDGSQ